MLEHSPLPTDPQRDARLDQPSPAIDQVAHLLPARGPITVVSHPNTLHAFEDLHFASYDSNPGDAEGSILARILGASVPVCAGINLESGMRRNWLMSANRHWQD